MKPVPAEIEPAVKSPTTPPMALPAGDLFGLMAEFEDHEELLAAAKAAHAAGYRHMDAYSPFPIDGLAEAIGREHTPVALFTLLGGMAGGLGAYFMEWYSMGRLYALNVGGRPLNSWPNFIPVTFELTVLIAGLSAFLSALALCRLPQVYHPVFNSPEFRRASIDRFFLCIEAKDQRFGRVRTRRFLEGLFAARVIEVEK